MALTHTASPTTLYGTASASLPTQLPSRPSLAVQPQPSNACVAGFRRKVTLCKQPARPSNKTSSPDKKVPSRTPKSVRFQDHDLEHVRLFLKTQRPCEIRHGDPTMAVRLAFPNWPPKTVLIGRQSQSPIRMEHIQADPSLSEAGVTLLGRCRVANLAFEKHVVVRYTTDYWKSFHETEAMFRESIGSSAPTWDRFTFSIHLRHALDDNLTVYLALRYTVNGHEFWDNNDGLNYHIDVIPDLECQDEDDKNDNVIHDGATRAKESETLHVARLPSAAPMPRSQCVDSLLVQQDQSVVSPRADGKLGHRYNFGASLSAAKKDIRPTPHYYTFNFHHHPQPPSPPLESTSCAEPVPKDDLGQYREFVNKYCFYGNSTTPPIPSCASPAPICG